ncbi:unnamed protein product, partial [Oppiella nova]
AAIGLKTSICLKFSDRCPTPDSVLIRVNHSEVMIKDIPHQPIQPIVVSEVNNYKRFYKELYRLGSGAFGEVLTNYGNVCKKCKNC